MNGSAITPWRVPQSALKPVAQVFMNVNDPADGLFEAIAADDIAAAEGLVKQEREQNRPAPGGEFQRFRQHRSDT
jgi:hypothetical protein